MVYRRPPTRTTSRRTPFTPFLCHLQIQAGDGRSGRDLPTRNRNQGILIWVDAHFILSVPGETVCNLVTGSDRNFRRLTVRTSEISDVATSPGDRARDFCSHRQPRRCVKSITCSPLSIAGLYQLVVSLLNGHAEGLSACLRLVIACGIASCSPG